jgi:hypothetical protein
MSRQSFREPLAPALADLATVAPSTTEVALIPVSTVSRLSVAALTALPGQVWKVTAGGVVTTGATAVNWTITPRWGTSNAGVTLGASQAVAKTVSLTGVPWMLQAWMVFRTINDTAATSSTAVMTGTFESAGMARDVVFGGTTATIDTTATAGFWFGIVASALDTSATFTPKLVVVEPLN